jgi:hypothetical protein
VSDHPDLVKWAILAEWKLRPIPNEIQESEKSLIVEHQAETGVCASRLNALRNNMTATSGREATPALRAATY